MNCKSNTVKYGTETYKICNGDAKNVNQRKNKESIWLHGCQGSGTKFYESVVRLAWRKDKFCEVGVANFLLKSWRKTSANEIRTFQYGSCVSTLSRSRPKSILGNSNPLNILLLQTSPNCLGRSWNPSTKRPERQLHSWASMSATQHFLRLSQSA